jgi:glucose/arabinose dehydrogenase
MQFRIIAHVVLGAGLGLTAFAAIAQSPAQPAADVCAAGGKYVNDEFSPRPAFPEQTRAPRPPASVGFQIETVVSNVNFGRSMAFMPDGRMLLAERGGRVRIVGRDGKPGLAIEGVPPMAKPSGLIGLMDIALDPAFAKNRFVYLVYVTPKDEPTPQPEQKTQSFGRPPDGIGHIAQARLSSKGDRLEALKEIYVGSRVRRLVASPDGTLYFSTVSGSGNGPQSLEQDGGKILRIRPDGRAAPDNPFVDRNDVGRFAYDVGHRDPDGLAQDASGRVWAVEHGPRGGDELNLIRAGRNYGYPVIGYGREYSGEEINNGLTAKDGLDQPVYFWTPDIAPSGLMVYSGRMFPQWKGNIFVGALVSESLVRLTMSGDKVLNEEFMLADRCKRIRDVREAPDGSIYVLTDYADGEVLRIRKM